MPREAQGSAQGEAAGQATGQAAGQAAGAVGNQPGGGLGQPINTPDPLSKYRWWILGSLALLLTAAAAFLLRRPATVPAVQGAVAVSPGTASAPGFAGYATPGAKNNALLHALKEELFALETEKLNGSLSPEEYAEVKPALEVVLKRALKRQSS